MPKPKVEAVLGSESDTESDQSVNESEDEGSDDFASTNVLANSTTKTKPSIDIKLQLAAAIRQQNCAKFRHNLGVKKILWNKLDFEGFETVDLQTHLSEIFKMAGTVRTLDEVLADYEKNYAKYSIFAHPDHPTRPANAQIRYTIDNREKLTQQLEKQTGKKVSYSEVFKFAAEKFKSLPEKKRSAYIDKYHADLEEYKKKKRELLDKNPELTMSKKEMSKKTALLRKKVEKKPLGLLTPFSYYREQLNKEGNTFAFSIAQKMWKDLPKEEKGKYVHELVELNTTQEKKITTQEMKYMEFFNGLPSRPLSAYNIFVHNFREGYDGDSKDFMVQVGAAWKNINEDEKHQLQVESDALVAEWKKKMQAYIRSLPKEQQPMMLSKFNLFNTPKEKKSKRPNASVGNQSPLTIHDEPPKKVKKTSESVSKVPTKKETPKETSKFFDPPARAKKIAKISESSESDIEKSPKKKINQFKEPENHSQSDNSASSPKKNKLAKQSITFAEPPPSAKKQKMSESSVSGSEKSPKKKKTKEPDYPSQSTAHYFMTKVYEGKPSKVHKAYSKLDRSTKRSYYEKMVSERNKYLVNIRTHFNEFTSNEMAAYQENLKKAKAKQLEDIAWHIDNGTDEEQSDSSESDSS